MRHSQTPLEDLIRGCRDESSSPEHTDAGYCFELFRRALEEGDDAAWAGLQHQYRRLVISWLQKGMKRPVAADEMDDLLQEALSKFWRTLSQKPGALSNHFPHVGALLRYLNQCAITTCLDVLRREKRAAQLQAQLEQEWGTNDSDGLDAEQREQLARVKRWVAESLTDEKEQLVMELSYGYGLSPARIAEAHPDYFPDARDVRRIKERLIKRARRSLKDE